MHEIIEDNFLGPWPRLVLPCPLNFHIRGCGHLAATCSLTLHAYVKHRAVGGFMARGAQRGTKDEKIISVTCDVFPEVREKLLRRVGKVAIRR